MPRNKIAVVDWDRLGPIVRQVAEEEVRAHGLHGYQLRVAQRLPGHGLTRERLNNYFRRDTAWTAHIMQIALHRTATAPVVEVPPPPPPPDPLEVERERREELARLAQRRELLRDVAGEESLRAHLEKLIRDAVPRLPSVAAPKLPAARKDTVTESLVLQLSDWHAYEEVDAERMRDFNAYNARIFGQRIYEVVRSAVSIKTRMERGGGWRFPRLVVAVNGDLVSGTIHEVERHTDAPNVVLAVYGCAMVLAQVLRTLAGEFPRVDVFCTPGNHGRLPDARRMQQKDPTRNWDTVIYLMAKTALADCATVRLTIPNAYSVAYDVEGWTFLQTHGHDVKSWNSLPFYGIDRMVRNINALEASRKRAIHYFLLAHFHAKSALEHTAGEAFINGSLIGGTEFSLNGLGKSDKPSQLLLGVHKEHGVSHRWALDALAPDGAPGYTVQPWKAAA